MDYTSFFKFTKYSYEIKSKYFFQKICEHFGEIKEILNYITRI